LSLTCELRPLPCVPSSHACSSSHPRVPRSSAGSTVAVGVNLQQGCAAPAVSLRKHPAPSCCPPVRPRARLRIPKLRLKPKTKHYSLSSCAESPTGSPPALLCLGGSPSPPPPRSPPLPASPSCQPLPRQCPQPAATPVPATAPTGPLFVSPKFPLPAPIWRT